MQNKLQELTDKLYNEGLARGKQEGEAILRDARAQAEKIISDARTEAAGIVADAGKKAEELRTKVEGDLKMAAGQSIAATKQRIETLLVNRMADASVSEALSSADFVKQIIKTVASAFNPAGGGAADLSVILPDSMKKELEPFVRKELATILNGKVEAGFSKKISGGFTIGPKGEGWYVSFTDETFRELVHSYLRPATKKILFGE